MKNATDSLGTFLRVTHTAISEQSKDKDYINTLKAGVIQNFEFSYELCWKFMKRWLSLQIGNSSVDGLSRRELFRISAENKLITDVSLWFEFHQARNLTSHTYNQNVANEVFKVVEKFAPEAKKLLLTLENKNA